METTVSLRYLGGLKTHAVHEESSTELITDAPTDNHGNGETFSPTDLIASSLVSCMMTVMGIEADKSDIQMGEVSGSVEKIMAPSPRRISQLNIELHFGSHQLNEAEKLILQDKALNCPVAKSIHPDIQVNVKFKYD